ncbi:MULTISPECIES: hypothetical protein [unclassified Exiguobacterium]|uniref:hypothetical protein n=1 Tax=unclassified Exiguobacterium TaxID=2644629 RepID=UPI002556AE60|nr:MULTISPECIES: hypothetical protein [unclassified Exiguobacterium]
MAAEKLSKTGTELGHDVKVETHGSIGIENGLTEQEIKEADGVIIAADKTVDLERFAGKRVVVVPVAEAIKQPAELIERIKTAPIQKGAVKDVKKEKDGNIVYRALMNGVSHMIPFVVGGLLIALALAIGGEPTANGLAIPEGSIWQKVLDVGAASFMFMVPILAGYIAYAIADRPALALGIVGGYIAANGSTTWKRH